MAEPEANRVRAAKLRAKKKLSPVDAKWLAAYDTRVTMAKAKADGTLPDAPAATALAVRPQASQVPENTTRADMSSGAASGDRTDAPAVVVHETVPVEGNVSPSEATWTPTVPESTADAEPPPPGAPPPPAPGAPLVEDAGPTQGQGDPAAAAQFAGLVVLVTGVGITSALELLGDIDAMPPLVAQLVSDEANHARVLQQVGAAAQRVAIKYNFRSVPLGDEAIVVGALAGSVASFVAVQRRKAKGKGRATTKRAPVAPPATADAPDAGEVVGSPAEAPWPDAVAAAFKGDR